jgi:hypothetical protein
MLFEHAPPPSLVQREWFAGSRERTFDDAARGNKFREARGASQGNEVREHQREFPQLAVRASKQRLVSR